MWLEYLATKGVSPGTLRNKVSHARVFVRLAGGSLTGFDNLRVTRAMEAMVRLKERPAASKDALPPAILRMALEATSDTGMGLIMRTAILIMFYGALRQSEVAPPSIKTFDPTRHLTRRDVSIGEQLNVRIKWGKNLQRFDQKKDITLSPMADPLTCPVKAVEDVLAMSPGLPPHAPLLVFPDTTTPVPTSYLRAEWGRIMTRIGQSTAQYSLHSLRKAAATTAYGGGCTELEVQRHGGWSSSAYRAYLKTQANKKINDILSRSITNS